MARWVSGLAALLLLVSVASAARKTPPPRIEPQIEEVTAKQLERVLEEKDYVAVFWCKCACAAGRPPAPGAPAARWLVSS
ncbi:unnamed protein product [Euphydryas editha]|uniref:Uncharacterized protein n=1 Tax=Euphydryas editha TaxID=104508 RepID=A0AAU9V9N3_EUPED|nr:unnamed protein product [Euphydryas editha]